MTTVTPTTLPTITIGTGADITGHPTTLTSVPAFEAPSLDAAFSAAVGLSGPLAVFGDSWKPAIGKLTGVTTLNLNSKPTTQFHVELDSFDSGFSQLSKFQFDDSLHGLVDGEHAYVPLFDTNAKKGDLGDGVIASSFQFGTPKQLQLGALIEANSASQAVASAKALSQGAAGAFAVISKTQQKPIKADGSGGGTFNEFFVAPITKHQTFSTRIGPEHTSGPLQLEGDGAPQVNFQDFAPNLVAIVDGNVLAVHHQPLAAAG